MIPVDERPPPIGFDQKVRQPGATFLGANPGRKDFRKHNYWKRATKDLYVAYNKICAYTCWYLPSPGSVDHFKPKATYPDLAYEWSNYRLAAERVNNHKADSTEVLDPFTIQDGWFALDFPSCLVVPGPAMPADAETAVLKSIDILRLNDDDYLVEARCELMVHFSLGNVGLQFLRDHYPFLAIEIERQNLQARAAEVFKTRN